MDEEKMNHSMGQHRLFFALLDDLNLDKEKAIKKAKDKFGVAHFRELNTKQMNELIKALNLMLKKTVPVPENRILKYRVFSKRLERYLVEEDFVDDFYWVMDFEGIGAEMQVVDSEGGDTDVMEFTGWQDYFKQDLYQFDIFIDRQKNKWMIDWDDEKHVWIAGNFDTNEKRMLFTFSAVKKIGSIYEEIKEEDK